MDLWVSCMSWSDSTTAGRTNMNQELLCCKAVDSSLGLLVGRRNGIAEFAGLEFAGLENDGLENDGVEQEQTYAFKVKPVLFEATATKSVVAQ